MRIQQTPPELRSLPHRYPPHNFGPGMERYCHLYLEEHAQETDSARVYLPIYWINNYYDQSRRLEQTGFRPVPAVQRFLDERLDPKEEYVTISLCPSGTYEQLPKNVMVLGAAGAGDVPLPLLCKPHKRQKADRDLLASFAGAVDCGGAGSAVRREMMRVFARLGDEFRLEDRTGADLLDASSFSAMLCRSQYALAPRGYGKTSFRLYEAMPLGAIPVYIYDDPWLPYDDVLDWTEFCVLCPAADLAGLPARLQDSPQQWVENARKLLVEKLVPEFFSFAGVAKQLKRIIESLD